MAGASIRRPRLFCGFGQLNEVCYLCYMYLKWICFTITVGLLLAIPNCAVSEESQEISLPPADAGLYISDLTTGKVVVDHNSDKLYIPASVTKAITTASVMSLHDSLERFVTPVIISGPVIDSELQGDLIIRGVGDPTLGSARWSSTAAVCDSVLKALRKAGIGSIKGSVRADENTLWVSNGVPSGWVDSDLTYYYGAELFAINFDGNTINISKGEPNRKTPALKIIEDRSPLRRVRGERQLRGKGSGRVANPVPYSTFISSLTQALERAGIKVKGEEVPHDGYERQIGTYSSPVFVDIMRSLMFRSDNLMAEGMLRALAPAESRSAALEEQRGVWEDFELDIKNIIVEDGSGLSRNNRLTPRFLGSLLEQMARSSVGRSYVSLFPRVGCEGTVKRLLKGTPLEGCLVLKSGSMNRVQSYAGYLLDDEGRATHVVVFMANGFKDRANLKLRLEKFLVNFFCRDNGIVESDSE